ncbi:hypothetical protein BABINDRAFT_164211 [Babjeviella inositovora NRRL Y-12698]|uniref:DH domain-containing protein n=1 Tax=Babjeviella inositovora NRRL Y-12698 TaxID=984486 RepID=A0A1E3QXN6_9ASCO|nr:uncharacterized protein BABINDRAFT_164211 [Babjeviella inositovora NRRL Y-12698]ODQ82416.1 hypothetical protein BABINDRAFT_164211 [Babjeviella inositovora NRRL Y-12698]
MASENLDKFCPSWLKNALATGGHPKDTKLSPEAFMVQGGDFPDILPDSTYAKDTHSNFNPYANSLWYSVTGTCQKDTIDRLAVSQKQIQPEVEKWELDTEAKASLKQEVGPITIPLLAHLELVQSELSFTGDLKVVQSVYKSLLLTYQYANSVSAQDVDVIFPSAICQFITLGNQLVNQISGSQNIASGDISPTLPHFSIAKIPLGTILLEFINFVKPLYLTYFLNYVKQIQTLNRLSRMGEPKVAEWLKEAQFLSKSKTNCWSLDSLLMTPVQRLFKYPALLKELSVQFGESLSSQENVKLQCAIVEVESTIQAANKGSTEDGQKDIHPSVHRREYADLVKGFKPRYHALTRIKATIEKSLENILDLMDVNIKYSKLWQKSNESGTSTVWNHENEPLDKDSRHRRNYSHNLSIVTKGSASLLYYTERPSTLKRDSSARGVTNNYIGSIYAAYVEKVTWQRSETKLVINDIRMTILTSMDLAMRYCEITKDKINEHRKLRSAYANYIQTSHTTRLGSKEDVTDFSATSLLASVFSKGSVMARKYVSLENQIRDELPQLILCLDELVSSVLQSYLKNLRKWLRLIIGERSLSEYQDIVEQLESFQRKEGDRTLTKYCDIIKFFIQAKEMTQASVESCIEAQHYGMEVTPPSSNRSEHPPVVIYENILSTLRAEQLESAQYAVYIS